MCECVCVFNCERVCVYTYSCAYLDKCKDNISCQ